MIAANTTSPITTCRILPSRSSVVMPFALSSPLNQGGWRGGNRVGPRPSLDHRTYWIGVNSPARSPRSRRASHPCSARRPTTTMPFQKESAPTAPGIRSDPSKRNVVSPCRISMLCFSRGLEALLGVEALVRADDTAEAHPVVRPGVAREVGAERLHLFGVAERDRELATTRDGLRVIRVHRRQHEGVDVAVRRHRVALVTVRVPEGLVERGLVVQRALAVEDRKARRLEGLADLRRHVADSAVDHVGVLQVVPDRVERVRDRRVVERDLVSHPLVVDVRPGLAKDEVLDPVGSRPAGGVTGLESDAPRLVVAFGCDRVRELRQLVEGRRDLVALVLELRRASTRCSP